MTGLYSMPLGEFDELKRVWSRAGLDAELGHIMRRDLDLTQDVVLDARHRVALKQPMFRRPSEVVDSLLQFTRSGSLIGMAAMARLCGKIQELGDFVSTVHTALSFDIWLGSVERTLWACSSWAYPILAKTMRFSDTPSAGDGEEYHLSEEVLATGRYDREPFIEPVIVRFAETWQGVLPADGHMLAGFEAMTALAAHPNLMHHLGHQNAPAVMFPALRATQGRLSRMPGFFRRADTHQAGLDMYNLHDIPPASIFPVVVEQL